MRKGSSCKIEKALHISQWIKGELGGTASGGGGGGGGGHGSRGNGRGDGGGGGGGGGGSRGSGYSGGGGNGYSGGGGSGYSGGDGSGYSGGGGGSGGCVSGGGVGVGGGIGVGGGVDGGSACAMDWGSGYRGGGGHYNHDDAEFELWSQERMDAKNTEIRRRLEENARDVCGSDVTVVCDTETVSAQSSPDDSQVIAWQYSVHQQYTVGGYCPTNSPF